LSISNTNFCQLTLVNIRFVLQKQVFPDKIFFLTFPDNFLTKDQFHDDCKIPRHLQVFQKSGHHALSVARW